MAEFLPKRCNNVTAEKLSMVFIYVYFDVEEKISFDKVLAKCYTWSKVVKINLLQISRVLLLETE